MPGHSVADHSASLPREYNAASDLLARNLGPAVRSRTAYIDDHGRYSFADLDQTSARIGALLTTAGLAREQRVLLCMHDSFLLPATFLGAIRRGIVPVLVNTQLTATDYAWMLGDSRARVAIVAAALLPVIEPLLATVPGFERIIVSGDTVPGHDCLEQLITQAAAAAEIAPTVADEACFWLYSSGSTGPPKGTVHVHSSLIHTAELYARPILGIAAEDVVFSASKLFFAYGLGNGLTFPLSVGATTILMAERATPAAVCKRLVELRPTIFYGVPTLYAALLADPALPPADAVRLRRCTSAGEALPADIGRRWARHFGVDILDGIGSTEMLHVFLSNRAEDVRYGTTGKPLPGYAARIVGDDGHEVAEGHRRIAGLRPDRGQHVLEQSQPIARDFRRRVDPHG